MSLSAPSRSSAACSASPERRRALLAAAVLVPALLGFQRYVITSGSMTGTYDRGSLVFDRVVPTASLRAGDVITFRPPGHAGLVTHRIASGPSRPARLHDEGRREPRARRWGPFTLGDARQARVAFHLPYLGYGIATLSERKVRMLVIGVPALLIALAALAGLWRDSTPKCVRSRHDPSPCTARRRSGGRLCGAGLPGDVLRQRQNAASSFTTAADFPPALTLTAPAAARSPTACRP